MKPRPAVLALACVTASAALLPSFATASRASSPSAVAIQPPGSFHGDEVVARDGERWLVLWQCADAPVARLAWARLRVAAVHDPLLDADGGPKTGREVSVPVPADGSEDPLLFLRGGGLQAGALKVAEVENTGGDGLPAMRLRFGARTLAIETRCAPAPREAGSAELRCRIELRDGGARQILFERAGMQGPGGPIFADGDAVTRLIFAGDLDRDGRLDLILDTTDHYNLRRPTVFLSGGAGEGRLLRAVAEHTATGC